MLNVLLEFDVVILFWVQENLRFSWLTPIMQFITSLADHGLLPIVSCIVLIGIKKYRKTGALACFSLGTGVVITNLILKNMVARTRPFITHEGLELLTKIPTDLSFPSGHTCAMFAVASVLFLSMPKKIGIPVLILAALVGFSRIYLGVHYPSDVLGGMIIGLICGFLCCRFFSNRFPF